MSKSDQSSPVPPLEHEVDEGLDDALDASLDYEGIAERSEADRRAGRVHGHDDIADWGARLAAELQARRRSA